MGSQIDVWIEAYNGSEQRAQICSKSSKYAPRKKCNQGIGNKLIWIFLRIGLWFTNLAVGRRMERSGGGIDGSSWVNGGAESSQLPVHIELYFIPRNVFRLILFGNAPSVSMLKSNYTLVSINAGCCPLKVKNIQAWWVSFIHVVSKIWISVVFNVWKTAHMCGRVLNYYFYRHTQNNTHTGHYPTLQSHTNASAHTQTHTNLNTHT